VGAFVTSHLLAATKFSAPALPVRYVERPRLLSALDSAAGLPLAIVVGVPGAGKTILLGSWTQGRPELRSVWLACDARDEDPGTFWLALITALSEVWPDRWLDALERLGNSAPDFDDVAISVVNDLARLGEPVVMVIDDFQFAARAAPSLLTLVEHLPSGCRVIVGSRTEPQLRLHRLRAYGELLEIRDVELRLTPAEVTAVMLEYGVQLTETELELVVERTEGWLAGVLMAAVSLRDGSDTDRFLADLAKTPTAIQDFLGTEVLDRQDAAIRDFMLATSTLDVLDSETCAVVTERLDAGEVLRSLAERNLFLIDVGGGAFRYHQLFGDLLRSRLQDADPDRVVALHRRVAAHFAEVGDAEHAIDHLLAVGDTDEAFAVLRRHLVAAFHQRDGRMPRRLVVRIESRSANVAPTHMPDLALALAASGSPGQAKPWIARAERHAADLNDANRARLALARALVALQDGDAVGIDRAFSDYSSPQDFPDPELAEFVPGLLARGRLFMGDLKGARQLCEEGEGSFSRVSLTGELAWVACVEGGLNEAEGLANQALAHAASIGLERHPVMVEAICAQGRVAFERANLASAESFFEMSLSICEDSRPALALVSQLLLARVWLADGRVADAMNGILRARAFLPPDSTSPLLEFCHALESRVAIAAGDLSRAERCAGRMDSGHGALILQTRIKVARREFDQAGQILARCAPVTVRQALDVAVLAARIACGRKTGDADTMLVAAIDFARPESFILAVADDLLDVKSRVAVLLRSRHVGSHEQLILNRLEGGLSLARTFDGERGPLSARELTVVRYLASRLTMREIAADLFVSTNTLKTHVRRIYGKFGVSSRTDAVAEARTLGLL
jgi:LuxR family transcriptional regulator, maltose regulon positive regulatory protein